ncbi:hypothetical protein E2C01_034085 [Portunus trituberculatus]|uniref:Uncharacterized protein n=1 Tax=Portunus trituberculatus TaxID=210409 RepID=A0A5B7F4I7_PORTR|nr:hypothetical protein [Portunus trituberculatus]
MHNTGTPCSSLSSCNKHTTLQHWYTANTGGAASPQTLPMTLNVTLYQVTVAVRSPPHTRTTLLGGGWAGRQAWSLWTYFL